MSIFKIVSISVNKNEMLVRYPDLGMKCEIKAHTMTKSVLCLFGGRGGGVIQ
jgi:hypothetical protein